MPNSEFTGALKRPRAALTQRERQVMQLMFDGCTTREISSKLGITVKTASTHRSNILTKLETHNTVLAFRRALRMGLVEP